MAGTKFKPTPETKARGKLIRREREAMGWTLKGLGAELGVSHVTVLNWEKGTVYEIEATHCHALAEKLPEIDPYYLLTKEQRPLFYKTRGEHKPPLVAIGEPRSALQYGAADPDDLTASARTIAALYDDLPEDDPAKKAAMDGLRAAHKARYPAVWRLQRDVNAEVIRQNRAKKRRRSD